MFALMCHITPERSPDHTVPCRIVFFVELFFHISSNVPLNIVSIQRLVRYIHSILLHLLVHIRILYNYFSISHFLLLLILPSILTSSKPPELFQKIPNLFHKNASVLQIDPSLRQNWPFWLNNYLTEYFLENSCLGFFYFLGCFEIFWVKWGS